jgi:Cu-Zn family superoxide dismutase
MRQTISVVTIVALVAACGEPGDELQSADSLALDTGAVTAMPQVATATLKDSAGREFGTLTLSQADSGIRVSGRVAGLAPGDHGIHLHAVGSCSPTFESAGGHWNPAAREHGAENAAGPHRGDLVNLQVGSDSSGAVDVVTPGGELRGVDALLDADGATVVVHAMRDDYRTDPDGGSGERVACGVVMQDGM